MNQIDGLGQKKCEWRLEDDDYGIWVGSCGALWRLESGTLVENGINFCPFCGNPVKEILSVGEV